MSDGPTVLSSLLPSFALFVGGPLLIWWLRRRKPMSPSGLKVTARTALTRNSVVAIVETSDRRFLLGATDQGVQLITELAAGDGTPALTDMEELPESMLPEGPRTSPLETLRAMTVRRAGRPGPFHAHRP